MPEASAGGRGSRGRGKPDRPRLQGEGTRADLALLEAVATVTGQTHGEIITAGLRLYVEGLPADQRKMAVELARIKGA